MPKTTPDKVAGEWLTTGDLSRLTGLDAKGVRALRRRFDGGATKGHGTSFRIHGPTLFGNIVRAADARQERGAAERAADLRWREARARKMEVEAERSSGNLLPRELVEQQTAAIAAIIREALTFVMERHPDIWESIDDALDRAQHEAEAFTDEHGGPSHGHE